MNGATRGITELARNPASISHANSNAGLPLLPAIPSLLGPVAKVVAIMQQPLDQMQNGSGKELLGDRRPCQVAHDDVTVARCRPHFVEPGSERVSSRKASPLLARLIDISTMRSTTRVQVFHFITSFPGSIPC